MKSALGKYFAKAWIRESLMTEESDSSEEDGKDFVNTYNKIDMKR